jgi:hypothetical protein
VLVLLAGLVLLAELAVGVEVHGRRGASPRSAPRLAKKPNRTGLDAMSGCTSTPASTVPARRVTSAP